MTTLTDFVMARLVEEGERLERVAPATEASGAAGVAFNANLARLRRELDAKRGIWVLHSRGEHKCSVYDGDDIDRHFYVIRDDECSTLRHIASIYDDHAEYRNEWRP